MSAWCRASVRWRRLERRRRSEPIAHDFDLTTLRLFQAAVRLGSISAAADEQHIAVSAVSRRLTDLEHRLGTALLYRRARGVEATPAGRTLLRHAESLLRLSDRAAGEMAEFAVGNKGHVTVAANPSAVTQFLPDILSAFCRLYPDIRVSLREQMSDAIVRDVADGQVDIGLFSAVVDHNGIETYVYRADRLCVVAPRGHPLSAARAVTFVDILAFPFVALEDGSSLLRYFQSLAENLDSPLDTVVSVRSFDGVRRMVAGDLGVSILPENVVAPYAESDGLTVITLDEPWVARQFLVGVRERASLSPAAARLYNHMLEDVETGSLAKP